MSDTNPSTSGPSIRDSIRAIIPSIIINGVIPFIIYLVFKHYNYSDLIALSASAVPPILFSIISIVRQRHMDLIAGLTLVGISVSVVAIFLGGDPKLLLIRESFVTGTLGLACFISFLFPRPLMFYFGRYFTTGKNPEKIVEYNRFWQYPIFRFFIRVITAVWGVVYLGEFLLRVVLVSTLTVAQVLIVSPIIFNSITIAVIAWTIAYSLRVRKRGEAMYGRD